MNLNWRWLITLVSGMVFVPGPVLAIDCEEHTRKEQGGRSSPFYQYSDTVVVGVIHNPRSHGIPEETLSEGDLFTISLASTSKLAHVILLEGDNTVRTLDIVGGESALRGASDEIELFETASLIGRRVRVTGCIDTRNSPPDPDPTMIAIDNLNDVELLE